MCIVLLFEILLTFTLLSWKTMCSALLPSMFGKYCIVITVRSEACHTWSQTVWTVHITVTFNFFNDEIKHRLCLTFFNPRSMLVTHFPTQAEDSALPICWNLLALSWFRTSWICMTQLVVAWRYIKKNSPNFEGIYKGTSSHLWMQRIFPWWRLRDWGKVIPLIDAGKCWGKVR